MIAVDLEALRQRLRAYVRRAMAGETILITDGERVVAELSPSCATRGELVSDKALAQAVRDGVLSPAVLGPGPPPDTTGVAPLRKVIADLDESRWDG